jgi:hypothetical protein
MIPLRSSFLAAAGLALSLAAGSPAAQAGPALSYWSHEAKYDQDSCAQRAQAVSAATAGRAFNATGTGSWPNAVR